MAITNVERIHAFSAAKKLQWFGEGEWVNEPDLVQFQYRDYECWVSRMVARESTENMHVYGGFLCGYVQMKEGDRYYNSTLENHCENPIDIDCHYGVTFCEDHVIGFDCAHSGDYCPSIEKFMKTMPNPFEESEAFLKMKSDMVHRGMGHLFKKTYRNVVFCIAECEEIVDQLISSRTTSTRSMGPV